MFKQAAIVGACILGLCIAVMTGPAAADGTCVYKGQTYSDGAINDQGQVCDGRTGTWR